MKEIKVAIFDLTDCEGCELQFLALREELAAKGKDFQLANWRLLSNGASTGPFDITFIEGSPITDDDVVAVKKARAASKTIVALGSCATFGGLQAALPESRRALNIQKVYGEKYKATSRSPKNISYYIDVDINLPGCPIDKNELERLLAAVTSGKKYKEIKYPVCLECKARNNTCLFLEDGFCLGPVTKGGCGAICPTNGLRCYGCFGPVEGANIEAMENVAGKYTDKKYLKDNLELYFKNAEEYKDYITKRK